MYKRQVQLSLTGEGSGTNTYVWSSSAGTTKDVTVTPTTNTTYTVTVTDAQNCDVVSSGISVSVVTLDGGSIEDANDAQGTISLCSGTAPGQLTGDGTGTSALGSGGTGVANQITYKWQKTTTQNNWTNSDISGEVGSDLNFTDLITNGTPVWVRRVATNLGIEAYSNELKFEAPALPSPTATATDATVASGGSTTLGVGLSLIHI